VTTELAVGGTAQYLAVWRVVATISAASDSAWGRICKAAAPGAAYLYVPGFTLTRAVVQRLGVSLTEAQPTLELTAGFSEDASKRPALVGVGGSKSGASAVRDQAYDGVTITAVTGPDFGTFSPVVVGRKEAHALAHFVYLAVESQETRDLRSVDYQLEAVGEELVFVPAVWDPRYVHESNWRLLLREFDGLVA
jgi:hypothetical protein